MTKQSFIDATYGQFNCIREFKGIRIANVAFHTNREWKIVEKDVEFDTITDRDYKPLHEFHLREDLWAYIKNVM